MFDNYIKVAFRNLARNKVFSVINILGLSIGLTISFIILLYVIDEFSFDRFHEDARLIYRVAAKGEIGGQPFDVAVNSALIGPELMNDFDEVTNFTRIYKVPQSVFLHHEDKKFYEDQILFVDTSFLSMFSFELISGEAMSALGQPFSLVMTESAANKYFGDEDPIGKVIRYNNNTEYTVNGIIRDPNKKSHIQFDFLVSFNTLYIYDDNYDLEQWTSLSFQNYIKLKEGVIYREFENKLIRYVDYKMDIDLREYGIIFISYLQPLLDIHLRSHLMSELGPNGDIFNIYILLAIALFILIIASINFMNLSTARSAVRAKEVGLRKVLGASHKKLIYQFVGESLLMSFIALFISLFFIEFLVTKSSDLVGKDLYINFHEDFYLIIVFFIIAGGIGFFAGSYPAFYLASFSPVKVLKGQYDRRSKRISLRNFLVVFQYAISIGMIIATLILYRQLNFVKNKKLGFDKENILVLPIRDIEQRESLHKLSDKYAELPGVVGYTTVSNIPGKEHFATAFWPQGVESNESWLIFNFFADHHFTKTLGVKIVQGKNLDSYKESKYSPVLINTTLQKQLKWENPIGKLFFTESGNRSELIVVGVVDDYHFKSLHTRMDPLIIRRIQDEISFMLIRIKPKNSEKTIEFLSKVWYEVDDRYPFDYFYLEDSYNEIYGTEDQLGRLFVYLTMFTIFIASLGLFGLASFIAEQRRTEIGIRKAMGATVKQVVVMLTKIFTKWVIISNLIAWPLAYLGMRHWLDKFEFKANIPIWIFLMAGAIALVIAILTVSFQALKAGWTNPAYTLRDE